MQSDVPGEAMKKLRVPNVPKELYEAVVRRAKENHRTISEEVVATLTEALEQEAEWMRRHGAQKKGLEES